MSFGKWIIKLEHSRKLRATLNSFSVKTVWRETADGSVVNGPCCPSRRPRVSSHYPHGGSLPPTGTHKHAGKTLTRVKNKCENTFSRETTYLKIFNLYIIHFSQEKCHVVNATLMICWEEKELMV